MAIATSGHGPGAHRAAGPFESLKELARTALDIVHTRFDLLVTEIHEEQGRVAELLLYAALALLCIIFAIVLVAVFVVASLWDTEYRLLATGSIAAALAIAGIACAVVFARKARAKPRLFSSSLVELGADLERLR
jgi:uncharacterized membrane protein YqjE